MRSSPHIDRRGVRRRVCTRRGDLSHLLLSLLLAAGVLPGCAEATLSESEPDAGGDPDIAADFTPTDDGESPLDAADDVADSGDGVSDPGAEPDLIVDPDLADDLPGDDAGDAGGDATPDAPVDDVVDDASVDVVPDGGGGGPFQVQFAPTAGFGELKSGTFTIRLFVGVPQPQGPASSAGYRVTFGPATAPSEEASE